jgi:hypothetical protein
VNGIAPLPQFSVILGRCNGQLDPACLKNLKPQEFGSYPLERILFPKTPQHLAKDKVRHSQPMSLQLPIQPARFRILRATQIVDPHGRVDDDHAAYSRTRVRRDS